MICRTPLKGLIAATVAGATLLAIAGVDRGGITFGMLNDATRSSAIVVADIAFSADGVAVVADGELVELGHLAAGQMLAVYGPVDSNEMLGKASLIVFDDNVDAPIDQIDAHDGAGLFMALGQQVQVTSETRFAGSIVPASIDGLQAGMHVEVSGHRTQAGVEATYIRLQPAGSQLEATGIASGVKPNARKLNINALKVDYKNAELVGFIDGYPVDGDLVEVRGWYVTGSGKLKATHLGKRPLLDVVAGTRVSLDGLLQAFRSAEEVFLVAGTPVSLLSTTVFGAGSRDNLADGQRIRVEGRFDEYGRVLADSVWLLP